MKKQKAKIVAALAAVFSVTLVGGIFGALASENENDGIFTANSATVTYDSALPDYVKKVSRNGKVFDASEIKGVLFKCDDSEKSTLTYNKVINVSRNTADIPLIEFMITPSKSSEKWKDYEARTFRIRLTDVYNAKNYITISANYRPDQNTDIACVRAGTANQSELGFIYSNKTYSDSYGTNIWMNFIGKPANNEGLFNVCSFSMDYATKKIYAGKLLNVPDGTAVKDLDDPSAILSGELLFEGFTTGECYLSIEFDRYADADPPKAMIFGINGNTINGKELVDETAPSIYLDDERISDSLPLAETGKKYPLPRVSALDNCDGFISSENITVKVYAGYNTSSVKEYEVKDGAFIPEKAGKYTVVYSVSDAKGNAGSYKTEVTALGTLPEIAFPNETEIKREFLSGEVLVLPETVITGGAGAYKTEIKLLSVSGKEIGIENGEAQLNVSGKYTLTYKITDYIGNEKIFAYSLSVEKRNVPLIEERFLPKYALKGKPLTIPSAKSYDFASFDAKKEVKTEIYAGMNGKERVLLGENLNYVPAETGTLTVVYKAKNLLNGEESSLSYNVEIVEPERIGEYFIDENGNAAREYDKETSGTFFRFIKDAKLTFINKLPVNGLSLEYSVNGGENNFKTLSLILQDSEKKGVLKKITFEKASETTAFVSVNGGNKVEFVSALFTSGDSASVSINGGYLYYNSVKLLKISDASDFGFTNGDAFVGIEAAGVSAESVILIETVDNQPVTSKKKDNIGPYIVWGKETVRYALKGERVYIPYVKAVDVLDPVSSAEVFLYAPSGKTVPLENKEGGQYVTFDECGTWFVMVRATDSLNNVTDTAGSVHVSQSEAPLLTVSGIKSKVKKGETLSFSVKAESGMNVTVFVSDNNGEFIEISENKYKFSEKGEYYLFFYSFNRDTYEYSVKRFKVTVK